MEQRDAYVERLLTELVQQSSACQDYTVDTVYFGGGTPSLLGGARIARIVDTVRAHYALEPDAEITAEANPDSMTDDFLTVSRASGVNRLSMGIQSANDRELRAIGRIHTFAQAQDAFFRARRAGFANLSVDLMYALPNQRMEQLCASLDALLDLQPEHLSCYGLTLEAHTPLGRQHPVLPDEDTQADMYLAVCDRMRRAGFEHYEISNFARKGLYSRHNMKYWTGGEYLGFGPSASSDFAGKRFTLKRDLQEYIAGIRDGGDIMEDLQEIPMRERAGEYLMLRLRTSQGISAAEYEKLFLLPFAPLEDVLEKRRRYYQATQNDSGRWVLTPQGYLVSNDIITDLLIAQDSSHPLKRI